MKTPRELHAIFGVTKWQPSFLKENNGTINMNDFLECTERHCNSKHRLLTALSAISFSMNQNGSVRKK